MDEFVRNIESQSFTQAANIALLCKVSGLNNFLKDGYPSGMKTFIKSVHKRTADGLAANENIEVSYKKKIFRPVHNRNEDGDMDITDSPHSIAKYVCQKKQYFCRA